MKKITIIGAGRVGESAAQILANEEHAHEGVSIHTSSEQCDGPTDKLLVVGDSNIKFDQQIYKVPKATCIEVTFKNTAEDIDHDMNIDEVTGDKGIKITHLHQANNTDGPNGDGTITLNILTPDADTEFEIYCSVPGHREAGMVSTLVVGEGNPDEKGLPAFELFGALFSISFIVLILKRRIN